jgi:hypothetical protein
MDVHHHPNLHHTPKPWKEYFLEFLMIFLAVTMGFFAETIRENISERAKGREYIQSFVQDLQADTVVFSTVIAFDETKVTALNNLSPCYDTIAKDSRSSTCLVPLITSSLANRELSFADGTVQQLKNAGGFRLLKRADKDSIVAFDHAIHSYQNF